MKKRNITSPSSKSSTRPKHSRMISNALLPQRLEEYRIKLSLALGRRIFNRMRDEKGSMEAYIQLAIQELRSNEVSENTIELIIRGAKEVVGAIVETEPLVSSATTIEEKKALFTKKEYLRLISKNTP